MLNSPPFAIGEELTRGGNQLRLLIEVAEAIATHRDLTTLFRDLARRLPAIVPFEFIALFLHDPVKDVMRVDMLGTADADSIPPGLEVPVGDSFSGLVFTTQQPVVVHSREEASRFSKTVSIMQKIDAESFCMLPLTTTVRRLGAMGFGSSLPRAFDTSELEFLRLVVTQVAVAVDNVLHAESATAIQLQLSQERDRLRPAPRGVGGDRRPSQRDRSVSRSRGTAPPRGAVRLYQSAHARSVAGRHAPARPCHTCGAHDPAASRNAGGRNGVRTGLENPATGDGLRP